MGKNYLYLSMEYWMQCRYLKTNSYLTTMIYLLGILLFRKDARSLCILMNLSNVFKYINEFLGFLKEKCNPMKFKLKQLLHWVIWNQTICI